MKKILDLALLSLTVFRYNWQEEKQVRRRFYKDLRFKKVDQSLLRAYFLKNPYLISREFWGVPCYGETPLTSFETLGKRLQLKRGDCFVDLGAGRGRGAFFLHFRFGCLVQAIEKVPTFIKKGKAIQKKYAVEGVEFLEGDLFGNLVENLQGGTHFYLAWTCFTDQEALELEGQLNRLKIGVLLITTSFPVKSDCFTPIDSFTISFPWGEADVFVQRKVK